MATYERFEDLPVWKEAACLYNDVADLLEEPNVALTGAFRNQMDRAALSISNNIAEGFERTTTAELQSFISIARGSAAEVRSMLAVVRNRPKLKQHAKALLKIQSRAESCGRQLGAWSKSIERLPFEGKRRMPEKQRLMNDAATKAAEYRIKFLRSLKPEHPLYNAPEARTARGETIE
jgi:four helix bundle protein